MASCPRCDASISTLYVASNYKLACPRCELELAFTRKWKIVHGGIQITLFLLIALQDQLALPAGAMTYLLFGVVGVHLFACSIASLVKNEKLRSPKWGENDSNTGL